MLNIVNVLEEGRFLPYICIKEILTDPERVQSINLIISFNQYHKFKKC